jgi:hypothetical protein
VEPLRLQLDLSEATTTPVLPLHKGERGKRRSGFPEAVQVVDSTLMLRVARPLAAKRQARWAVERSAPRSALVWPAAMPMEREVGQLARAHENARSLGLAEPRQGGLQPLDDTWLPHSTRGRV